MGPQPVLMAIGSGQHRACPEVGPEPTPSPGEDENKKNCHLPQSSVSLTKGIPGPEAAATVCQSQMYAMARRSRLGTAPRQPPASAVGNKVVTRKERCEIVNPRWCSISFPRHLPRALETQSEHEDTIMCNHLNCKSTASARAGSNKDQTHPCVCASLQLCGCPFE